MVEAISMGIIYVLLFTALYFEVLLLLVFVENFLYNQNTKEEKRFSRHLSVTIIVPCYNEEGTLRQTVDSLLNLDYPKDKIKVLLVDDGSKDNTYKLAKNYEQKYSRVKALAKENGGKHTAINLGLEYTDTELVGCLDADSFTHPQALNNILPHFEREEVMAVTPAIKVHYPRTISQLIQSAEYMFSIFIRRTFSFMNALFVTPGPFSIFKTEIFREVGHFKPAHNTEDLEICMRIQSYKYKVGNAHTGIVYTNAPQTIKALFKQRVRWTYGFLKNALDYKFMIFRPSYGALGMLVLPMTMISIFSALYFMGFILFGFTNKAAAAAEMIGAIGLKFPQIKVSWFFMSTEVMSMIIYLLIGLTIAIVIAGKKISEEDRLFTKDILFYVFLYGLIAPFWLGKAVYNTALSKKGDWAAEHDSR